MGGGLLPDRPTNEVPPSALGTAFSAPNTRGVGERAPWTYWARIRSRDPSTGSDGSSQFTLLLLVANSRVMGARFQ